MSAQKLHPTPSQNSPQQHEFNDPHLNSSLLPKIHKSIVLAKRKNDHHLQAQITKMVITEGEEYEKRMKMAGIIHDYLDNFKMKQRGTILAFSSQKSKLEQKPIKVEGISHSRFVGIENLNEEQRGYSLDVKKKYRLKINRSFIDKVRNDCKTDEMKKRPKKFYTESDGTLQSISDLKGYVLKAKKSVIDCRELSKQKISRSKKLSQVGPW